MTRFKFGCATLFLPRLCLGVSKAFRGVVVLLAAVG